ncbi:MAG: hypothetical protein RMK99_02245 [Anaerolineales bacterium]|nr:hypothetical protein [Anaerolineales bacterium]
MGLVFVARLDSIVFSRKQRTPELAELEAKFYADADPERVWNRPFSNSIRSGRG